MQAQITNKSRSNALPATDRAARTEAYNIAESVIGIFTNTFPDVAVFEMALPVALDVAEGRHDLETMATTRGWAYGALQSAMDTSCRVGPDQACKYYAACMAAETVVMALDPVIDIEKMKVVAAEAMKYSESPSNSAH